MDTVEVFLRGWHSFYTLLITLVSLGAGGKYMFFRLDRIEKMLSNGTGLVQRMQDTEREMARVTAACSERHHALDRLTEQITSRLDRIYDKLFSDKG